MAVKLRVWVPSLRVTVTKLVASSLNSRAASTLAQVLVMLELLTSSPTLTACSVPLSVTLYATAATGAAPPPGTTKEDTWAALLPATVAVVTPAPGSVTLLAETDTTSTTLTPVTVKAWLSFRAVIVRVRAAAS